MHILVKGGKAKGFLFPKILSYTVLLVYILSQFAFIVISIINFHVTVVQ